VLKLLNVSGNPNVGVFVRATEAHAFCPISLTASERRSVQEALEVEVVTSSVGGTSLVGSLLAANRHGVVVGDIATVRELKVLKATGLKLLTLDDPFNAVGNNVLVTDAGALVNPDYSDEVIAGFEKVFGVPVHKGTLAGLGTVGMGGVATPGGVLVHPKSTPEERETARRAFGREVMVGTINHGTGLIGAGLVANSKGALIGDASTNIEIGRIEDALGFLPAAPSRR
jgi:translation initiation factor 6